uniref:Uncharacterized protein n=1 Tax=Physcomitrium patens TaxID=3218 RepID=A0A2K1L1F4_PHYPA|nr:hypothetical protein PHYPA_002647 [Physcomitrium patens]
MQVIDVIFDVKDIINDLKKDYSWFF